MSNLVSGLSFSLCFASDFEDQDMAQKILEVFLSAPASVRPKKFGAFQPSEKIQETSAVLDVLTNKAGNKAGVRAGSLILEHSKSCSYQVQWNKTNRPTFSFISGHLMFSAMSKGTVLDDFIALVKQLAVVLSPAYGEIRSMAVKNWDAPMNLLIRLPDVPPVSIYGKEYIAHFGEEKIKAFPFGTVEQVGEGYWVTAHPSVLEEVPSARRAEVRSYFGEQSFMADGKWRYTEGSAPDFDLAFSIV